MSNEKKNQALTDCNSKDWIELYGHEYAEVLFEQDPSKAFQRHIREMHAEADPRPQIESLDGAVVAQIDNDEAGALIRKIEWLGGMAPSTIVSYGLRLNGELLGVECFGTGGSPEARVICLPDPDNGLRDRTICLVRGGCVHFSPRKAPSYLIRQSCKLAYQEFGWQIFTAYADPQAGELGQIYKFAGWQYIGQNIGRNSERGHESWISPSGETASTHSYRQKAISLGWTEEMGKMGITKAQFLRNIGWEEKDITPKHKFVRFEGPRKERERLREMCQYEPLPFPKRENSQ